MKPIRKSQRKQKAKERVSLSEVIKLKNWTRNRQQCQMPHKGTENCLLDLTFQKILRLFYEMGLVEWIIAAKTYCQVLTSAREYEKVGRSVGCLEEHAKNRTKAVTIRRFLD